ncbi:NADPH-dependent FMN reductase domain-containing protein [Streptococcus pneumoniae]|nr:NADPH-dependent FMN reductase domain-containing protein [Streptococcus pneumoniae]
MLKLIAIVGTNSKRSTNRQLLQYMQKHFTDKAEIELVEIKAIPVFNKPADKQVPAEILEIAAKIEEADGVIIGTPEYDHSIPAVLMSALAWLSYGIYPLLNKPIMITGASYGTLGSSRAQLQLRQILNPNHSYLSQLDVTYKTPDLMSHFLPPHEVSFTFCCSSIVFPR